jgi:hypothetical protein
VILRALTGALLLFAGEMAQKAEEPHEYPGYYCGVPNCTFDLEVVPGSTIIVDPAVPTQCMADGKSWISPHPGQCFTADEPQ